MTQRIERIERIDSLSHNAYVAVYECNGIGYHGWTIAERLDMMSRCAWNVQYACLFVAYHLLLSISGHFINSSYTLSHHSSCSLVRRGPDISACNICVKCRSRISVVPGRQAGRHDWFYYTSTKCAIRSQMTWQDSNASRKHS